MGSIDSETEQIIHKVFLVNSPIKQWRYALPKLTDSETFDRETYALFALICRQFIQTWHVSISGEDPEFLMELCKILSKIMIPIKSAIQQLSISDALLDDIPYLIKLHVQDIRSIKQRQLAGIIPIGQENFRKSFHALHPFKALDSIENERIFLRTISARLAQIILPSSEQDSPLVKSLITSIISDIALSNAVEKLSQPWMIHEIIVKIMEKTTENKLKDHISSSNSEIETAAPLVFQLKQLQLKTSEKIARIFKFFGKLTANSVLLLRNSQSEPTENPLVIRQVFPFLTSLLQLDIRRPLLIACAEAMSIPFRYGMLADVSSRLARSLIRQTLGNIDFATNIVRISRESLFTDNGYMGPPRTIPSEEEQKQVRSKLINQIIECTPETLRTQLFGSKPDICVEEIVSLFDDEFINKHLMYNLLDYLLISLFPSIIKHSTTPTPNS